MPRLPSTWFVFVVLTCMFSGLGVFVYWMLFDERIPIASTSVETSGEDGVPRSAFRAGEPLFVHRSFCVDRDLPVGVGRFLVREDHRAQYVINNSTSMLKRGCWDGTNVVQIPPFVTPGRYRYSVIMQFMRNPVSDGAVELQAPMIEIVR